MDCGEICQLEIAPRFAYGKHGNGKDIPADATILYTVELLSISKEKDLEDVAIDERLVIGYHFNLFLFKFLLFKQVFYAEIRNEREGTGGTVVETTIQLSSATAVL